MALSWFIKLKLAMRWGIVSSVRMPFTSLVTISARPKTGNSKLVLIGLQAQSNRNKQPILIYFFIILYEYTYKV